MKKEKIKWFSAALQSLLDLPTWVRINCARVNSIALKIQWTSLQSKPIRISLDHIELDAEALQQPRSPNGPSPIQDLSGGSQSARNHGFLIFFEIEKFFWKFILFKFRLLCFQGYLGYLARQSWLIKNRISLVKSKITFSNF